MENFSFNGQQPLLPGTTEPFDPDYMDSIDLTDRVNGLPVTAYHYSIPQFGFTPPPEAEDEGMDWLDELGDDDDDEAVEDGDSTSNCDGYARIWSLDP